MMTQVQPGNVHSFSIGFEDRSFDETRYARRVAGHLGTHHHERFLDQRTMLDILPTITSLLDEPMADASIVPTYLLSMFARESVKVVLGGDGGDELFAGYPTIQAHRAAKYYRRLPGFARGTAMARVAQNLPVSMDNISFDFKVKRFIDGADHDLPERHVRWLGSFTAEARAEVLRREVSETIERERGTDLVLEHWRRLPLREDLNKVLYLDMKLYLENDILVKVDRASMMASLEARVPMLNLDMLAHVLPMPLSLKLRRFQTKYVLRRALAEILPKDVLERPKKGFGIPVGKWLQSELREELLDTLEPGRIGRQGLFRPAVVQRLVEDHLASRRDNRKQLWNLLVFQRWHQHFIEAPTKPTAPISRA
jgi:asparagine synthase (glutamine-hydrolysing)